MRRVPRPTVSARDSYSTCISRVRNPDLKRRLRSVADHVATQSVNYQICASATRLDLIRQTENVANVVTTKEMVAVYDQRMAGKKGPGRHIYDKIKSLPQFGICPFCDHRPVSTLDHLLPKGLFPDFAVTPDNLIGACADCNKLKLDFAPLTEADVLLHPYFDNVENGRWLTAEVVEGRVAAVLFRTKPVAEWPSVLNDRVKQQFKMLGLSSLYGAQAAREISEQAFLLGNIHDSSGMDYVRAELIGQAQSREYAYLNSWRAVMCRALGESDWFCDGGFRGT